MKVTGAISLYVHACTSLCRLAAVSAVAALLCMSVMSCSDDGKRGDERTPEHEAALKSLDDSIFVKSEYVMRTMREGMANAADSLDYYDFFIQSCFTPQTCSVSITVIIIRSRTEKT